VKALTSRIRFDEQRRFTAVQEEMGRVRLDADANEQARLVRTDARRRSGDLAEGSPDDGFRIVRTQLLDPIRSLAGWSGEPLPSDDERRIRPELGLDRRDPETLPQVVRSRGHIRVRRRLDASLDLLRLPLPPHGSGPATYAATALVVPVRFERPPTDDEIVRIRILVLDAAGQAHTPGFMLAGNEELNDELSGEQLADGWLRLRIPLAELDALRVTEPGTDRTGLPITGWGLTGLPPRAEVRIDGLEAEDQALAPADFVIRGGDGTLAGAGRIYVHGWRSFIEGDWRYTRQPDLPAPPLLARPADPEEREHLVYLDLWERPIHGFQDAFLQEPALDGEDTSFRTRKVSQVRVVEVARGTLPDTPLSPTGAGRLTTNIAQGALPDRNPPEQPDPCRDLCLFTENASTGDGYLGSENCHVRVEILAGGEQPIVAWSRNNAATVAPLVRDGTPGASSVEVAPEAAEAFQAGDLVTVEDERTRLDPRRFTPELRQLRAVDTATGRLELQPPNTPLVAGQTPSELLVGGPLERQYARRAQAAVRRWDGADWLLTDLRYNLADGISFAFSGADFRVGEYWTFTARVTHPDGAASGVVDSLDAAPVHGPCHELVPLARIRWRGEGPQYEDLRRRFLPLHEVRDRLIELGQRKLTPGAFTVVVGDGVRTFGDLDQNIAEGVTGDEVLQAALDRLGGAGGTIYVRAGRYFLEHPVLIRGRGRIRIVGDGDATELVVTGAGGAFYLDWCGAGGETRIASLRLVEQPELATPIGGGGLIPVDLSTTPASSIAVSSALVLRPSDLQTTATGLGGLLDQLTERIAGLRRGAGRAAASVVATLIELRRLQRLHPGQPLEDIAASQLEVLRHLPHGVVTISDSSRVTLEGLTLVSRESPAAGAVAAAVLMTGECADIAVRDCTMQAPSGVVAAAYARYLAPAALVLRPRAGLALARVLVQGNHIRPLAGDGRREVGVRLDDGLIRGVTIDRNDIDGFPLGVLIEDRAEEGLGGDAFRTRVDDNRVTSREIGIRVIGDQVDLTGNQVSLGAGEALLRTCVQLAGRGHRLSDCALRLTGTSTPELGLEAAIVVGSGGDFGGLLDRSTGDIEITASRIEGPGAAGRGIGVLVGGTQPIYGVRIHDNSIRNLGDAAVRAWGDAGAVGALEIADNHIDAVALTYAVWTSATIAALRALVPGAADSLADTTGPRGALEALLAVTGSEVRPALDATLRWLECATLRGGVVLSLAEESRVHDNRIGAVGSADLPTALAGLELPVRTAGIACVGGHDLALDDNRIKRVIGGHRTLQITPPGAAQRPPIFDFLTPLGVRGVSVPAVRDTHGALVALRAQLMDYALGDARARQRIGGKVYGAMEAMEAALEERGREGKRLALELSDANAAMRNAQGLEAHTLAANQTRAVLSDAARLTAEVDAIASAWHLAARFDHALLGDTEAVAALASEIAEQADDLVAGLGALDIGLAESAAAVIAAPEDDGTQLRLARDLGTLAAARTREEALRKAVPEGGLTREDATVLTGIADLMDRRLQTIDAAALNETEIAGLRDANAALVSNLRTAHAELGERLRQDFETIERSAGTPTQSQLDRLRGTLTDVVAYARDPARGTEVRAADLGPQEVRFNAELAILAAEQLDRRIGGLATDVESSSTRELRVLTKTAGQLTNLVAGEPSLVERAREVEQSLDLALRDPEQRTLHQISARDALRELQTEQGRLAGARLGIVEPVAPESGRDTAKRLAGMGQLLIELRARTDAETLALGIALLDEHIHQATELLELKPSEREGLLRALPAAGSALRDPGGSATARAQALHVFSDVLDRLGELAVKRPAATSQDRAVRIINHALQLVLDPVPGEGDRLTALSRWVRANRAGLSGSVADALQWATTLSDALAAADRGLARVTRVRTSPAATTEAAPRVEAYPADGLFTAGVQGHLSLEDNRTGETRLGLSVAGHEDHALAMPVDDPQLILQVEGNRVVGAAVAAIELGLTGRAVADVLHNQLIGCAGACDPQGQDGGAAVLAVSGTGTLRLGGNRLRENGSRRAGLLHEVRIQWHGDIALDGNQVRHAGAGSGGCGLVIMPGQIDNTLLSRLSRTPALDVEPAPKAASPADTRSVAITTPPQGSDRSATSLAGALATRAAQVGIAERFDLGSIKLGVRKKQPSYRRLSVTPRPKATPTLAHAGAEAWLGLARPTLVDPIRDFLDRRPPILFPPLAPAPPQRTLHLVDNDVVASGPALLVLGDSTALVSTTLVANELESSAVTGAAYLRQVDTTLVSGNRFECLDEVNVLVVRAGAAQVSITGNAIIGAEPPAPPALPLPFQPIPIPSDRLQAAPSVGDTGTAAAAGGLHLAVDLGTGAQLKIPIDATAVRRVLDEKRDLGYSKVADDAEAGFVRFASKTSWTPNPDAVDYFKGTAAVRRLKLAADTSAVKLAGAVPTTAEPAGTAAPQPTDASGTEATTATGDATEAGATATEPRLDVPRNIRLASPSAAAATEAEAAKETAAIESFNLFLSDPALSPAAKLYGIYRATGKSEVEAKGSVKVHMAASGGDQQTALIDGLRTVTGIETGKPTVKYQAAQRTPLLEELVSEAIGRADTLPAAPDQAETRPAAAAPPPDPRDHSVVIIGGSRVGAINNVTTAGVHVHDADQFIENNL
jgi:hypothetical protein